MQLSSDDRRYIAGLREAGVLRDDDSRKLHTPNGVILVCCSDGDQSEDVYGHTCHLAEGNGGKRRLHPFMNHGGAALLSPRNLIYADHAPDEYLIAQIRDAMPMKGIATIALVVHAPCGAANMVDLSVVEIIDHMFRGKKRLKELWPNMRVACFVQVDFGDRKRMYFVKRKEFGAWYERWEIEELDRLDNDMEEMSDLDPDTAREVLAARSDDADIAATMPDPDEDKTFNDPNTERLIRQMQESGQHLAVTPADLR